MRRNRPALFKGRHFEAEIIVLCVRWYLRFGLGLSESGGTIGRAECQRRPCHDLALGPEIRAGTTPMLPVGTADDEPIVASGRDLSQDRGQMDLPI